MNKAIPIILIIGVGITMGGLLLTFVENETETFDKIDEPVRLSINPFPGTDYAFVAQEMGFFEKHGVDVELVLNPNYSQTVELFTTNQVDGAFEVYADAVLQSHFGNEVTVVYVTDQSTNGDVIIASVKDISDIKGKTVGVVGLNSFSQIFVTSILERNGIGYFDVFYENVDETSILNYLDDEIIVAGHTWEPTKSDAVKKGYSVIASAGEIPGIITDVLVFHSSFVNENPNDVQGVVNALNEARNFVYSNPEKSISIMAEVEGLSFDEMAEAVNDADRPDSDSQKILFSKDSGNSLHVLGQTYVDFYINSGLLSENENHTDDHNTNFIDDTFVNSLD